MLDVHDRPDDVLLLQEVDLLEPRVVYYHVAAPLLLHTARLSPHLPSYYILLTLLTPKLSSTQNTSTPNLLNLPFVFAIEPNQVNFQAKVKESVPRKGIINIRLKI